MKDEKKSVKEDNPERKNSDNDEKSWAEEAKQELEDFIESQGVYIRQ